MIQSDRLWDYVYSRFDYSDSLAEHSLRLMESLSDHFFGLRVVAACYPGAYLPCIISLHFQFRRSESSSLFSFSVQNHHRFSISALRATIAFQFRYSKPSSSLFNFGVQSHHHLFSILTFRFIIASQFRRLEPHHRFQFWCSKPSSSFFSFGVQSHHRLSVSAFRVIIIAF